MSVGDAQGRQPYLQRAPSRPTVWRVRPPVLVTRRRDAIVALANEPAPTDLKLPPK